jgi:hypothetical protein
MKSRQQMKAFPYSWQSRLTGWSLCPFICKVAHSMTPQEQPEVSDYFKAVHHCSCISGAPLPAVCNTLFLQSGGGPYFHLFKKIFTASSVCQGVILQISDFMLANICQVSMHPK